MVVIVGEMVLVLVCGSSSGRTIISAVAILMRSQGSQLVVATKAPSPIAREGVSESASATRLVET